MTSQILFAMQTGCHALLLLERHPTKNYLLMTKSTNYFPSRQKYINRLLLQILIFYLKVIIMFIIVGCNAKVYLGSNQVFLKLTKHLNKILGLQVIIYLYQHTHHLHNMILLLKERFLKSVVKFQIPDRKTFLLMYFSLFNESFYSFLRTMAVEC